MIFEANAEQWREVLYPLGFLSSAAFGGRALLQWIQSEIKKESVVTKKFWQLSILGNVLLMLHALIQLQFHVCVVQGCNAVISWRNINLMKEKHASLKTVFLLLFATIALTALAFLAQGMVFEGVSHWFRIPLSPWSQHRILYLSFYWHIVGFIGIVLFASRFWVQWWNAERNKKSTLSPSFWWISLIGDLLCLFYFAQIKDPVNLIGPALSLIPYIRNLMLIHRSKKAAS